MANRILIALALCTFSGTGLGQTAAPDAAGNRTRELPAPAASSGRLDVRLPGGVVVVVPPSGGPGVAYATTSIKCGDTIYQVSTGTSGGACSVTGPIDKPNTGTTCTDGDSRASATCVEGCGPSAGSG